MTRAVQPTALTRDGMRALRWLANKGGTSTLRAWRIKGSDLGDAMAAELVVGHLTPMGGSFVELTAAGRALAAKE